MIIKYKSLYELGQTFYLVQYPNEEVYRIITIKDNGEIIKNEIANGAKWFVCALFEKIVHSERKKHENK